MKIGDLTASMPSTYSVADVGSFISFSAPEKPKSWFKIPYKILAIFNTYVSAFPKGPIYSRVFTDGRAMAIRDLIRSSCHLVGLDPLLIRAENRLFAFLAKHKDRLYHPNEAEDGVYRVSEIIDEAANTPVSREIIKGVTDKLAKLELEADMQAIEDKLNVMEKAAQNDDDDDEDNGGSKVGPN